MLGVFETILYARDLDAAERFYTDVLGFEVIERAEVLVALRCEHGVLLIFDPVKSSVPGRGVPAHGTEGNGHVAFTMPESELESWRARLAEKGVAVEMEVDWSAGGRSIYFRDPAGNSLELAPPTLWGGGWF